MADRWTSTKERASRISLDYFRRRDPITRWKLRLAILAALLGIGWSAFALVGDRAASLSPGALSWSHAPWESRCANCHVDFVPLRNDGWLAAGKATRELTNRQCESCHLGAVHHESQLPLQIGCADCHQEHRGRDASLVNTNDRACVACHGQLTLHRQSNVEADVLGARIADHVTDFAGDHPPFRSIGEDPGKLKFSHRRHLLPGLTLGAVSRDDAMALENIPAQRRDQYRQFATGARGVLQLDCRSCHEDDAEAQPDGIDRRQSAAEYPRTAYLRPVSYERHCRACHPLRTEPSRGATIAAEADAIPHGLSAAGLTEAVRRLATTQAVDRDPSVLDRPLVRDSRLPNKHDTDGLEQLRESRDQRIHSVLGYLSSAVCSKCHVLADEANDTAAPQVVPVEVPRVWFKHARFDHSVHRFMRDCRSCHAVPTTDAIRSSVENSLAKPDAPPVGTLLDHNDVLIPGIDACRQCHTRSPTVESLAGGPGARTDCVECHRYHPRSLTGDSASQGQRGAHFEHGRLPERADAVERAWSLERLLNAPRHELRRIGSDAAVRGW